MAGIFSDNKSWFNEYLNQVKSRLQNPAQAVLDAIPKTDEEMMNQFAGGGVLGTVGRVNHELFQREYLKDIYKKLKDIYDEGFTPDEAWQAVNESYIPKDQKDILNTLLKKEDNLGFDYPHQAITELMVNPQAYEVSPYFKGILTKQSNLWAGNKK